MHGDTKLQEIGDVKWQLYLKSVLYFSNAQYDLLVLYKTLTFRMATLELSRQ